MCNSVRCALTLTGMNKVYCYHPCTTIVHFLFSEKACSCTFGIPTNKAFKMCLKGTKNLHSFLTSLFDPDVVKQRCRKCFKTSSMDHIPKRPRVQASRVAGSRRYTHTLIHNHARTHTHTHLIRDREAQDGHLDFQSSLALT